MPSSLAPPALTALTADRRAFADALVQASRLSSLGRHAAADAELDHAVERAGHDDDRVAATVLQATNRLLNLFDAEAAERSLDRAAALVTDERGQDELSRYYGGLFILTGRTHAGARRCREVLARRRIGPDALAETEEYLVLAEWLLGRPPDPHRRSAHPRVAFVVGLCSMLDPADARRPEPEPDATDDPGLRSIGLLARSARREWAGDLAGARTALDDALTALGEGGPGTPPPAGLVRGHLSIVWAQRAYCSVLLGDLDGAATALARARAHRSPAVRLDEFPVERAHAWLTAAQGHRREAQRHLAATAEQCGRMQQITPALAAWVDVARLGDADGAAEGARLLAATWPTTRTAGVAHLLTLWRDGPPAELARSSARRRDQGLLLYAAEAAARASHLSAARSQPRQAARLARTARAITAQHGPWWSPSFDSARHHHLTPRERHIADLIRLGLANREIGRRLEISVRTVENHAQSVYTKLGVHSRDELNLVWDDPAGGPLAR